MIGRLVDTHARRGRRLTYAALAVAGVAVAAVGVLVLTGDDEQARVATVVRNVVPATFQVEARATAAPSGLGSAWVLDRDAGLLVTAAHVVNSGQRSSSTAAGEAEAQVVGAAPCEDLAVLRVRAPLGARAARASATPTRARPCSRSASRRAPSRTSRRPPTAASCPPRTRFRRPRRRCARVLRRDPHRHRARSRVLGRAARGSRRPRRRASTPPRARSVTTSARCRAPTTRSTARARATCWRRFATGAGAPRSASTSATRTRDSLDERGLPPGLLVRGDAAALGRRARGTRSSDLIVAVNGRAIGRTLSGWCDATKGIASGQTAELQLGLPRRRRRSVDVRLTDPDVAVIGAGIVGCALAAFLAEAGASVLLVERDDVGRRRVGAQLRDPPASDGRARSRRCSRRACATTASWPRRASALPAEPHGRADARRHRGAARRRARGAAARVPRAAAPRRSPPASRPRSSPRSRRGWRACGWRPGYPVGPAGATRAFAARAAAAGARARHRRHRRARARRHQRRRRPARPAGAVVVAAGPWTPELVDPPGPGGRSRRSGAS